ncbi:MAG: spermidine synthase [Acidobacteriota bacterium]
MLTAPRRVFLSSFLVLFLEVALIRWLPAQIRLLSYFSNFILLASFLGIGIGALLGRHRRALFAWHPLLLLAVVAVVYFLRLEVRIDAPGSIYFTSGTSEAVTAVETTLLLPILFVGVAALFVALAQRMAGEMAALPPLRAYTINLAGSLAGVGAFAVASWLEARPSTWFIVALVAAAPFLRGARWSVAGVIGVTCLAASVWLAADMQRGTIWSPYYKITVKHQGFETVLEVNNIWHQSMAPVGTKEYFYQWPYMVFGDTFVDVLILGAGSGTDVAAALRHGVARVDAVEIDPAILRLGQTGHPDRPYSDPRVHPVTDDARHFLRTTRKKYDLVVFALIDSLTVQSAFSGVRLESYMFTEESFRAVRDVLKPEGALVVYNYFREPWLVDRLANTAAEAFGDEPMVYVHPAKDQLGVLVVGPRLQMLSGYPAPPSEVTAYNQGSPLAPPVRHERDRAIVPATDNWPFLYMREPHLPSHYTSVLAVILIVSFVSVFGVVRGAVRRWSWEFFFLGAGFMLLETKSIIQFALLWGSTWVVASLTIAAVLVMALLANWTVALVEVRRPRLVGTILLALLAVNYVVPVGTIGFESRLGESVVYSLLVFSPIYCAGLLFGSSIKRSPDVTIDYGANLLGAMAGGVCEYLSLLMGFQFLLVLVAAFYVAALAGRRVTAP